MTDFTYRGEALLLSWTDSSAGRKVTFLLPDDGEQHPFKDYKTGPVHGQPFGIGCKPVDYDNPEKQEATEKPQRKMTESQICGMLCADPGFWDWLSKGYDMPLGWEPSKEWAASIVKNHCGMDSRSELDSDPEGEHTKRWQRLRSQYETDTGRVAERRR